MGADPGYPLVFDTLRQYNKSLPPWSRFAGDGNVL